MSLKTKFKQNLFDNLANLGPTKKILVVDEATVRILNIFKSSDFLEVGIYSIESIKIKREPLPGFSIVYLISQDSVSLLIKEPNFREIHVFISEPLERSFLLKIQRSLLVPRLATLKELWYSNLIQDNCFIGVDDGVKNISSVAFILGLTPIIKFKSKEEDWIEELNKNIGQLDNHNLLKEEAIFLILDRSFDPITPLLHDLTYKNMCYDLVEELVGSKLKIDDKVFLMGEEAWLGLENKELKEVADNIHNSTKKLTKSKKAHRIIQEIGIRQNLKNHLFLIETCIKNFREWNLEKIVETEEKIIAGKAKLADIKRIYVDEQIREKDKLRLLTLYSLIYPKDWDKFKQNVDLSLFIEEHKLSGEDFVLPKFKNWIPLISHHLRELVKEFPRTPILIYVNGGITLTEISLVKKLAKDKEIWLASDRIIRF